MFCQGGVIGMTKSLALEGAKHRINVNAIAPGLIDTRMSRARGIDDVIPFVPWPRIGYPIDCANTIAFLASDVSEFITGQIIGVNGGQYLGGH
jgi:3-oxoacyl-[acyl-carrier protein] reductase